MREIKLNIGEVAVSGEKNSLYSCLGLGSCMGVFLVDRATGLSGGAHILLPDTCSYLKVDNQYYTISDSLNELLSRFQKAGSTLQNLRAKIAGGAHVVNTPYSVGTENAVQTIRYLINQRIYIAAQDLGGVLSRTAKFDAAKERMFIHFSQTNELKIY